MLKSSPVIAFAAAADLDRARAFYEQVLGLPVVEQNDPGSGRNADLTARSAG